MQSADTALRNAIELRAAASEIAAPKPDGSRRQSEKKTILKHFLKMILKGKLLAPKLRKSADKWLPLCSYSNTIHCFQLQKMQVLRMQPRRSATLTQPLHCDLQAQIHYTHRTTHTGTTTRCRTQRRNTFATETTAAAPAAHTRYLSSPAAATLHGKNTRFRAPASSPKQNPCNIHAAITMRFAASCNKPASLYAHGNTRSENNHAAIPMRSATADSTHA